jgi:hypothetical protein
MGKTSQICNTGKKRRKLSFAGSAECYLLRAESLICGLAFMEA